MMLGMLTKKNKGAAALKPGDVMPDGTVYVGISPTTGTALFTTPQDESLSSFWRKAVKRAQNKVAHNHDDWRLPTAEELDLLYRNKEQGALAGSFNAAAQSTVGGRYWSSSEIEGDDIWHQRFTDGKKGVSPKVRVPAAVRLVRTAPA